MINITDKINNNSHITFDHKIIPNKYDKNDEIESIIDVVSLFTFKYHFLYPYKTLDKQFGREINELQKYVIKTYKSPLLYNPISLSFVSDYMFWVDNKDIISNKKSVGLFRTGINVCEALMYYNTKINNINNVNYYIYPIFTKTRPSKETFDTYSSKLKKIYEGENITYVNTVESEYICDIYEQLIKKIGKDFFDVLMFEFRIFGDDSNDYMNPIYHLVSFYISLCTLKKGGTYIFRIIYNPFSKEYMTDILTIASIFFNRIYASYTKIRTMNNIRIICRDYIGPDSFHDLKKQIREIIQLGNNLNPKCGVFDKKGDNIITRLINDKSINPDVKAGVDKLYDNITRQKEKILKIYNETISQLVTLKSDDMIKFYEHNIELNFRKNVALGMYYDLKMTNEVMYKFKYIPHELTKLEIYQYPLSISMVITDRKNINNEIIVSEIPDLKISSLKAIREKLNLYKIGIDTRNPERWNKVTHIVNVSQGIIDHIKQYNNIDITRGFVKMYEILSMFNLVKSSFSDLVSLHICESPGNFINATHFYIKTFFPEIKHQWYASSLNPNSGNKVGLPDSYGFIKSYPDNWIWGYDGTGDITKESTLKQLKDKFHEKVDLFTSDCGFGASTRYEYNEQESVMGMINVAQILSGLITLKIGGNAVFKLYIPFTTPVSISLMYILCHFFNDVIVSKPLTGSPTNNEIYVIAISKNTSLTERSERILTGFINNFDNGVYLSPHIDNNFVDQLNHISKIITNNQIDNLKVIYEAYDKKSIDMKKINKIKHEYYMKWMRQFRADKIDRINLLSGTR